MPRILCVGIATIDIVNTVSAYPPEDSELRALAQQIRVGGNAANTATVLAQLGGEVAWAGNLSSGPETALVYESFARHGVDCSHASVIPASHMPTSYVTLSRETGSRSIVHYRNLPEFSAEDFRSIDLRNFDWVHFEGRAVDELGPMMERARASCGLPLSLEVEKPREGIEDLFGEADLLMFSHDYLAAPGPVEPAAFLQNLPAGGMATCTWGKRGAWARDPAGDILHVDALPIEAVDTLGAGDVFNAGLLSAITHGVPLETALAQANRLAGEQCAKEGLVLHADNPASSAEVGPDT